MIAAATGRAWSFGDDVDTDQMAPMGSMTLSPEERRPMLFPKHPTFAREVRAGDVIVAGRNWGCGSSREQAVRHLLDLGVAAVVAESFSRIFFRNSIALGLPALVCPGVSSAVVDGATVVVDPVGATVSIPAENIILAARPFTPLMLDILSHGGLMGVLKTRVSDGVAVRLPSSPRT